jgi:hypothetical protein
MMRRNKNRNMGKFYAKQIINKLRDWERKEEEVGEGKKN